MLEQVTWAHNGYVDQRSWVLEHPRSKDKKGREKMKEDWLELNKLALGRKPTY